MTAALRAFLDSPEGFAAAFVAAALLLGHSTGWGREA